MTDSFTQDQFAWLKQVAADPEVPASAFKLAFVVATHINRQSREAWPAQGRLASGAGVSERQVRTLTDHLAERGHLAVERQRGRGLTNRYRLNLRRPEEPEKPEVGFLSSADLPGSGLPAFEPENRKSSAEKPEVGFLQNTLREHSEFAAQRARGELLVECRSPQRSVRQVPTETGVPSPERGAPSIRSPEVSTGAVRLTTKAPEVPIDELETVRRRCLDAAMLIDSPALMAFGPIADLLEAGWSLERHVLPALRRAGASGKRGRTWSYYSPIVTDDRARPEPVPPPPGASSKADQERGWRNKLVQWKRGRWDRIWGPEPLEPGCEVPVDFVERWREEAVA